jgi:hypothetical protein
MNLKALLPESIRFNLRRFVRRAKVRAPLFTPWRWEAVRWTGPRYDLVALAPRGARHVRELFGLTAEPRPCPLSDALDPRVALVTPMIVPGALRVPCELHTIVPLHGRPLEDIVARYDRELRRTLKKHRAAYAFTRVTDPAEIEQLDREMLVPYAKDRHGENAFVMSLESVKRMALGTGRLDVITCNGEPVACHLGYSLTRDGQAHFITLRFGYPPSVFQDAKRLREVNAMNTYLALEWSHQNGYHGYDMGSASARPDDGLLQWKRRRDGAVDALHTEEWLSVRPPLGAAASFLWDHPLFAVEHGQLELLLGVAPGVTDDEAAARWRQLGFSGLARVHIYAERQLSPKLVEGVKAVFDGQTLKPAELSVHAPGAPLGVPVPQPAT